MNLKIVIDGIEFEFWAWEYDNEKLLTISWIRKGYYDYFRRDFNLNDMLIENTAGLTFDEIIAIHKLVRRYKTMKAFL